MNSSGFSQLLVKTKLGRDVRKKFLTHNGDLSLSELQLFVQRIYDIDASTQFVLRYRDTDSDFITLNDDNDVLHAIRNEASLFIEVDTGLTPIQSQEDLLYLLNKAKKSIEDTIESFVASTLTTGQHHQHTSKKAFVESKCATPAKEHENVATIQPSVQEFVQGISNAHQHEERHEFHQEHDLSNSRTSGVTESADSHVETDAQSQQSDISAFEQLNLNEGKHESESAINGFNTREELPQNPYAQVAPMPQYTPSPVAPQQQQQFGTAPPPNSVAPQQPQYGQHQTSQTPTPNHFYQQQQQPVPSPYQQQPQYGQQEPPKPMAPPQFGAPPQGTVSPQQQQPPVFQQQQPPVFQQQAAGERMFRQSPQCPQPTNAFGQPPAVGFAQGFQNQQQSSQQHQQPQQQQQGPPQFGNPQQFTQQPLQGPGAFQQGPPPPSSIGPPPSTGFPPSGGNPGMNPFARPQAGPGAYIILLSEGGYYKDTARLVASTGYYTIPVYNIGKYILQVHALNGLQFDVASYVVHFDEKWNNDQSKEVDFEAIGYWVKGVIKNYDGKDRIGVRLGNEVTKVEADVNANGEYSFIAVPGNYVVQVVDGKEHCIQQDSIDIIVKDQAIEGSSFEVTGHTLTASIGETTNLNPFDARVSISSHTKTEPISCQKGIFKSDLDENSCTLVKSIHDKFEFKCLSPGHYVVTSKMIDSSSIFEPPFMNVHLKQEDVAVSFKIKGFQIKGQVVASESGIENVKIFVKGNVIATSSKNGFFIWNGVEEGKHILTAEKKGYMFNGIKVDLKSTVRALPNITAAKIEVCGQITLENGSQATIFDILIRNKKWDIEETIQSESDGSFCYYAVPAVYAIVVKNKQFHLKPNEHVVNVVDVPVTNIQFLQFQALLKVKVICLEDCNSIEVNLKYPNGNVKILPLSNKKEALFGSLTPGFYKVSVLDGGLKCWENKEVNVRILDKKENTVKMIQTGFKLRFEAPISSSFTLTHVEKKAEYVTRFVEAFEEREECVMESGQYMVVTDSCYRLTNPILDTSIPNKQVLAIDKIIVKGSIKLNNFVWTEPINFIIRGKNEDYPIVAVVDKNSNHAFEAEIPYDSIWNVMQIESHSKNIIFDTKSSDLILNKNCEKNKVVLVVDRAFYVNGSVTPSIEGVQVFNSDGKEAAHSDVGGQFTIGPIRNVSEINITLFKEGYKFEKIGTYNYKAIKLSSLTITIKDRYTSKHLGNSLISLSGLNDYRKNTFINESGTITLFDLAGGVYFCTPFLQEYKFEEDVYQVKISDETDSEIVIYGKQVSFSNYGKISFINGVAASGIKVSAFSKGCNGFQEEGISDDKGNYRIAGLHSNCLYKLTLVDSDQHKITAYPSSFEILIKDSFIENTKFYVSQFTSELDILVELEFVGMPKPSSTFIAIYRGNEKIGKHVLGIDRKTLHLSQYPLDNQTYTVKITPATRLNYQPLDEVSKSVNRNNAVTPSTVQQPQPNYQPLPNYQPVPEIPRKPTDSTSKNQYLQVNTCNLGPDASKPGPAINNYASFQSLGHALKEPSDLLKKKTTPITSIYLVEEYKKAGNLDTLPTLTTDQLKHVLHINPNGTRHPLHTQIKAYYARTYPQRTALFYEDCFSNFITITKARLSKIEKINGDTHVQTIPSQLISFDKNGRCLLQDDKQGFCGWKVGRKGNFVE
uniref:PB1 domain-containing protein n=1 Tax=Rhabditophanes sp. KR3021 TaxID=114890 RepID=A0AC35TQ56_9BILA